MQTAVTFVDVRFASATRGLGKAGSWGQLIP